MHWTVIIPLIVFVIIIFGIGFWSNKFVRSSDSFLSEYFLGGREMGGFLLAMTMMATYGSASSFISGPGVAYNTGLGWVLLALAQLPAGYFVLMILGKKFAIVTRKLKSITLIDFLRSRYDSNSVVIISAVSIIIFLFASMVAQWVGGARLIESLTGMSYTTALFIFAAVVLIYVIIGGFRAVALTDALQGSIMVIGTIILLVGVVIAGGGIDAIMGKLVTENAELVSPFGVGHVYSPAYVSSFWILVGVGVIGLPQIAVRAMSYKNAKGMHSAILIGTIGIATIMFGMHLVGIFGRAVIPGIALGDKVMPTLTMGVLPPVLAGIVLAAPMAAIMSTVNALLMMVSSTIVKDVYLHYIKPNATENHIKKTSFLSTAVVGILVVFMSFNPPEVIVWLNLFAFGGLEAVFVWPIVLGLYWRKANKYGALAAMLIGLAMYIAITQFAPNIYGVHSVTFPVLTSFIAFVIVSLVTHKKVKAAPDYI
ncbi:sodium/pantothenate symporter [Kurthia sibirica]|uniref:Sodium/panthothenate symporter n=1 Tax=Kurthia sibirica TaxID=202750 RepID=A0A2U3AMJ8_9BACL|nr:sodium/pantothenate symporter [Kurthia sibirica]PWI25755.1 sodium/panthothenate symporter [Kurthia sibirica]GEK35591.1 sodium/panthothenate symporter [Kurthia sibirica]